MTSSATPPTCPQVEPIKILFFQLFKMADELDSSSSEFSDTSSSFLYSSLESSVSEREASLRTLAEKQLALNAKVLIANGEKKLQMV